MNSLFRSTPSANAFVFVQEIVRFIVDFIAHTACNSADLCVLSDYWLIQKEAAW